MKITTKERTISILGGKIITALELACPECDEPIYISLKDASEIDHEDECNFAFTVCRDCGANINIG